VEAANKELTERKYKGDATVRELKAKLSGVEEVLNVASPHPHFIHSFICLGQ
jgi:spindle assembly abnormal protein 6